MGPYFVSTVCLASHRICSSPLLVFLLILAAAFWLFQLLRSVCNLFSYWDIQVFYREALHIPPVSWMSVSVEGCHVGGEVGAKGNSEHMADVKDVSKAPHTRLHFIPMSKCTRR